MPAFSRTVFLLAVAALLAACGQAPASAARPGDGKPSASTPSALSSGSLPSPANAQFGYQPLWPFRTIKEAEAWQGSYRSGGHQPWHLDAGQTALSFTTGYLGFADIDLVVSSRFDGEEAHVSVGYHTPNGGSATAAVVHLVHFASGTDAPWEVVGTDDAPAFSLTLPGYGASVTSPVTVGGSITGVDESIKVQVRQPSSSIPIGAYCCQPAGGTSSPWRVTVAFHEAGDPVSTIVAFTGGHLRLVERFAVTGVRPVATR